MAILLTIHIFITLGLIGVILMQRSDGGLGLGASNPTDTAFSARGTANLLTRATAVLATLFLLNGLVMGVIVKRQTTQISAVLEPISRTPEIPQ